MRLILATCLALSLPALAEKPNVLFIAIDDLRPELGCYGAEQVKTPHIDKLAGESLLLNRAYCQIAVCGASRASLMTGIWPTPKRYITYTSRADEDTPGAKTLPQVFKEAGYTTISNGKIFHYPQDSGEQSWSQPAWRSKSKGGRGLDPTTREKLSQRKRGRIYEMPDVEDGAYADGDTARQTIADLKRLKEEGKPFFLACGFFKPHLPFYAPKRYWNLYDREKIVLADNRQRPKGAPGALKGSGEFRSYHLAGMDEKSDEFHAVMRHGYLACVSYVDKLVGDVLAELDKQGLADNTIVVLWGDHGFHLGEHEFWGKHNTMTLSSRVPLIVKAPGGKAGPSQALVETSDIFPTLCELAGLEAPKSVQGKSFVTLTKDPSAKFREAAFCRFGPGDGVFTDGFSYTRYKDGSEMLYDLAKDPQENVNLIKDKAHAATAEKMRKLLDERQAAAKAWKLK